MQKNEFSAPKANCRGLFHQKGAAAKPVYCRAELQQPGMQVRSAETYPWTGRMRALTGRTAVQRAFAASEQPDDSLPVCGRRSSPLNACKVMAVLL
jgi:hypothetical protein